VESQVLVAEHPFGFDIVRRLTPGNGALKNPTASQMIQ
jgi:hypothetical protein